MTFSIPALRPTTTEDFTWAAGELSKALMIYNTEIQDPFRLAYSCELSEEDWLLEDDSGDYAHLALDSILFFQPYMLGDRFQQERIPNWPLSRIHDLYQAKQDWEGLEDSPNQPEDYDWSAFFDFIRDNPEIPQLIKDWTSNHGSS